MKLSSKTIAVLKNVKSINQGIIIRAGNRIRTVANERHTFVSAVVPDEFPRDVAIFDLSEFLASYDLLGNPEIKFEDSFLVMQNGSTKIKYFYASHSVITIPPEKEIVLPDPCVKFKLTSDILPTILKSASILSGKVVTFRNGLMFVSNTGKDNENSFTQEIEMEKVDDPTFQFSIDVSRLKLMTDLDYMVEFTKTPTGGATRFFNNDFGIEYIIAIND